MTIQDFFSEHPKAALAFSGGVDSAYLLYAGIQAGADIRPYYVKSQFQPRFEYGDAMRLCRELGAEPRVLHVDALRSKDVVRNGPDRCYHCKINIMSTILAAAAADGYPILLDGTNASGSCRPCGSAGSPSPRSGGSAGRRGSLPGTSPPTPVSPPG